MHVPELWNGLPEDIKHSDSYVTCIYIYIYSSNVVGYMSFGYWTIGKCALQISSSSSPFSSSAYYYYYYVLSKNIKPIVILIMTAFKEVLI
jgi:hypothetical protein